MREDIDARLRDLRTAIESARSVPMSASVMFNRIELLTLLTGLENTIHETLSHASEVVEGRAALVDSGRVEATEILREAERRSEDLVSDTGMFKLAQLRAEEVRASAETEAEELRRETDAYVEAKLANLEHSLDKAAERIRASRENLANQGIADEALRIETGQYVTEQLISFEETLTDASAVLRKGRAQLAGGHVHGLGDDSDVDQIALSPHLER